MITEAEVILRMLFEDVAFEELLRKLPEDLHGEADYLYQEGVKVSDIEELLQ